MLAALACLAVAAASGTPLANATPARSVLVVVLAPGHGRATDENAELGRALLSIPSLSLGVLSTAQGDYTAKSMFEDIRRVRIAATARPGIHIRTLYLPNVASSLAELRSPTSARAPNELIAILQRARTAESHELVWSAVAGLDRGGRALTSQTTRQDGLVAAMDVAPTLLRYLRLPAPTGMPGHPIEPGTLGASALPALKARLEAIYPRRLPALACLLGAWALLLATAYLPLTIATRTARVRRALRIGALALLWTPVAALLPAALQPSAAGEYALLTATAFALGSLADACLPWPRAPIAPAVGAVVAIGVDALAGTQLLARSLLGPNPAYGSRFYGIGNELKSALAVLVLAAVAAGLYRATRSRRAAATMAGAGALLALVEGPARIGADVGGVILVCAATGVASAMLLPGKPLRRRLALMALTAPAVGLLVLAAVDLATAHGAGHFTGSVLHAHSLADLRSLIVRRYRAAWHELGNGLMPLATALAAPLLGAAVRYRRELLAPVSSDPAWEAALAGGIVAGVAGTLVEDSGPVLLLVAAFALACVLGYLWGSPDDRSTAPHESRVAAAGRPRELVVPISNIG